MQTTPHLALPLLAAAQAQKHVTHNEALLDLDALVHLAVIRRDLALAPASPAEGDRYIVAPGAAGAWAGHEGEVAHQQDGLWRFHLPRPGWLAYLLQEGALVAWTGTAWGPALGTGGEVQAGRLGIGTAPSAANPLSARLNGALLAARPPAEGGTGSLRLALSKEGAAATASLVFQDAYAGRAEIGLVGDDDLSLKVSADGQAWREALRVARATGEVSFPAGARWPPAFRNRIINGAFTVNQRGQAGAALAPGAYGHDRWKAGAGGCTYTAAQDGADTALSIAAGSLHQVIEDANVEGGAYVLSWAGTALGRVNGGAPAASPIVVADLPAGQAVGVGFSGGTLGRVQLEPGAAATPFERRPAGLELALCQRYFERGRFHVFGNASAAGFYVGSRTVFATTKRAAPSIVMATISTSPTGTSGLALMTPDGFSVYATSTAATALIEWTADWTASAEL